MPDENNTPELQEQPRDAVIITGEAKSALKKDIRYRGPLSYRGLRILGWLTFAVAQIGFVMGIYFIVKPESAEKFGTLQTVLSYFGVLMMPFFLLANFSLILRARESYKKILFFYLGMTLAVVVGFYIVVERYLGAVVNLIAETPAERNALIDTIFRGSMAKGLNVFLDLLLCTLFAFFLNYKPKKFFQGKSIIVFRLFSLLVIAYEIASFMLKLFQAIGVFSLPHWVYPWLTCKPPVVLLAFVTISIFIKIREKIFMKKGGTPESYEAFLQTNRNSLHVSIFMAIVFAVFAIIDLVALVILSSITIAVALPPEAAATASEDAILESALNALASTGLGKGFSLIALSPIALLYSYTREHKNPKIDRFVPIGGIALIAIIYLEGLYFIITHLG